MDDLTHKERPIFQNIVPDVSLGDESPSTNPVEIVRDEFAKEVRGPEIGRNWVDVLSPGV